MRKGLARKGSAQRLSFSSTFTCHRHAALERGTIRGGIKGRESGIYLKGRESGVLLKGGESGVHLKGRESGVHLSGGNFGGISAMNVWPVRCLSNCLSACGPCASHVVQMVKLGQLMQVHFGPMIGPLHASHGKSRPGHNGHL